MKMFLQLIKMLISVILLTVWLILTAVLGFMAIVTVFPAIAIILFPEILFIWLIPVLVLLVFGGLIPQEKIFGSIEKIEKNDDNIF